MRRKLILISALGCSIPVLCILLFVALLVIPLPTSVPWPSDIDDCAEVGFAFMMSIVTKNTTTAKRFSTPDAWQSIDDWMDTHQGLQYCAMGDPDVDGQLSSGGQLDSSGQVREISGQYSCPRQGYTIKFESVRFTPTTEGCKVVSWNANEEIGAPR